MLQTYIYNYTLQNKNDVNISLKYSRTSKETADQGTLELFINFSIYTIVSYFFKKKDQIMSSLIQIYLILKSWSYLKVNYEII